MTIYDYDDKTDQIGERIRAARKAAGLSQAELAQKIGVSQPAIATWESGAHDPRRLVLVKLANALSVPHDWLASGARSHVEQDQRASAPYLRRAVHHVPLISFQSAAHFADRPEADPHAMAEDYISVTANTSRLFGLFMNDPAVEHTFPTGTMVVIDYADRTPTEGNYCLALVDGVAVVRRWRTNPARLEPDTISEGRGSVMVSEAVKIIGCARLSIRLH